MTSIRRYQQLEAQVLEVLAAGGWWTSVEVARAAGEELFPIQLALLRCHNRGAIDGDRYSKPPRYRIPEAHREC